MYYTLTTNPAIDMNIRSKGIFSKRINRTSDAVYTPNGKGINVSFVLEHFGVSSGILGFFGGFSGEYIVKEIEERGFSVFPIWVDTPTRINVFLNDGNQEYKFVNDGASVSRKKQLEMLECIKTLSDMDYLGVSGSLSAGMEPEYYDEILKICQAREIPVILDISSSRLKELLRYHPLLIKPNDEEIRAIFGMTMENEKESIAVLDHLHMKGAQNILLTMGEKGSYFSNGVSIYKKDLIFQMVYRFIIVKLIP